MKDKGHEETDKIIKAIEKDVTKEYAKAEKELQKKLNDYMKKFRTKDAIKAKAVADGKITQGEYDKWRIGQLMIGKRWEEMKDAISEDLSNATQIARSTVLEHMPDVYAINHNYGTFQIEKGALVDTSYTLYDRQTVERLMTDAGGNFIPQPGKRLKKKIDEGKVKEWNKRNAQSAMLQGILQGESVGDIATRLQKLGRSIIEEDIKNRDEMTAKQLARILTKRNREASIRNARTMATGVENAGRIDSYRRAEGMGIKVKKQWMAALDDRTRHWHRELDGVTVGTEEPFENEYGEIMYPGDPSADPANIYNCRCTLIASVEKYERDLSNPDIRPMDSLENMTYEEWKESHKSHSDPITKQDDIARRMKGAYINEYKRLAED